MMGGVTQPDDPADTRMMGIVHSALRRDLVRARLVLAEPAPLTGERRTALADHVRWLMDFLHHHHTTRTPACTRRSSRRTPPRVSCSP